MPDTHTYHITRNCLKTGRIYLTPRAKGFFPREGRFEALDAETGETLELALLDATTVGGVGTFYSRHALEPNDLLILARDGDRYTLTPTARPRRADYSRKEVQRKLVDRVVERAPLSEREIRAMFEDLPADFDLAAVLQADGRLSKYEGRWQFALEGEMLAEQGRPYAGGYTPPSVVTVSPSRSDERFALNSAGPTGDSTLQSRTRAALETFGFRLEPRSFMQLLAHADLGRRKYSVLVQILAEGTRLDWTQLLTQKRELKATHLAVFGAHQDLLRLQSPARQAKATLWSWQGLERALDLVAAVPVSPFDLELHFARDGLFEEGLRRFERMIEKRVDGRGDFSTVLQRLAGLRAPSVFLLEDVIVDTDLTREQALGVLNLLAEAPFNLISRVDNGEFSIRQSVQENLVQLSHYALSLTERLPVRRTEQVRGTFVAEAADQDTLFATVSRDPASERPQKV